MSIRSEPGSVIPLLMLNGVGSAYGRFDGLRQHLGRTSLTFDVAPPQLGLYRPSIRTFASRVATMLDELGLDRVDLLGLSWGGMAAQQLVHNHPGRVRRLVLASTTPGFVSVPARPRSTWALVSPKRSSKRAAQLNRHLYAGDFLRNPSLIHELDLLWPVDRATYHRQLWASMGWTSVPWLHSVRQPTLILHANDDPVIPFTNARLMQRLMPSATLHAVDGGGHLYLYTRPAALGRRICEFLAD